MQSSKRLAGWALVMLAAVVGQLLWLPGVLAEPQYITVLHFNDSHGQLLPFEQAGKSVGGIARMATVDLTGQQLLAVLEFDAALPRPAGGFLQVSGLNLVIDGDKVSEVTVGGKPLQPDKTYRVAANDFLLAGGDGYSMLARGENATYVGSTLSSIVIDALKARGQVTAQVEGRITIR